MKKRKYKIFPALMLLVLSSSTAFTQDSLWKAYIDAGTKAYQAQQFVEAERRFNLARKEAESFGPRDPRLGLTFCKLALVYLKQDKIPEAKKFSSQALNIFDTANWGETPGVLPLEVADILYGMASLFLNKGEFTIVELALNQRLKIQTTVLKADEDPRIAATLRDLAITNYLQKKNTEAVAAFNKALAIFEKVNDKTSHVVIIEAYIAFAQISELQEEYARAESFLDDALAFREKNREPEYLDIKVLQPLARLYRSQGKHAESQTAFARRLKITEIAYGANDLHVVIALVDLADAYALDEDYRRAESRYQEALRILEKVPGDSRETKVRILASRALVYRNQHSNSAALALVQQCLEITEQLVGAENARFAGFLDDQGSILIDLEKYAEAEPILKRGLSIRERVLKAEDPKFITNLNNLAKDYYYQGKYDQSEPLYQRAIALGEKNEKVSANDLAWYRKNYALLLYAVGKDAQAETLFQSALEVFAKNRNEGSVAHSWYELAELYRRQKKYQKADPLYEKALELMEKPGRDQFTFATALEKYAALLRETLRESEAIKLEARAKEIKSRESQKP